MKARGSDDDSAMRAGFIGLGAMGRPMAARLADAGCLHLVWNRTVEKAATFVAAHHPVRLAGSPAEMAADCDVVLTCVSADADLLEIIDAMRAGLHTGMIVVDTSTVSVDTVQEVSSSLKQAGVEFIDAPVSGGVEGAINGTLSMMAGGNAAALERVRPLLSHVTARTVHMGVSGSGQATKAVNQIMAAGINQAVSEALAFAEAMELDMDKVIDVVGAGAAANWFLQHRGESMTRAQFDPGFKVALHHKDLKLCQTMMQALAQADKGLPIVEMTLIHYQRLMDEGYADEDISSLFRLKRRLFE